jgi:hypothetical protein
MVCLPDRVIACKVKTLGRISVAVTLARALGRPIGGSGVEWVLYAKSAVSAERQATLLERRESAIGAATTHPAAVLRTPRVFDIRVGGRGEPDQQDQCKENGRRYCLHNIYPHLLLRSRPGC